MNKTMINARHLAKNFGPTMALKEITFEVAKGEVLGFLGPNGAGKTTTISMLCTLLTPTSGRATVNGYDTLKQRRQVQRAIGLVFQDPTLDDYLTAEQNLLFHAYAYGVPRGEREKRLGQLLELVELSDRRKSKVSTYSGGMKRRLEIARSLLHHPEILFLDEPTLGLDPQTRNHMWQYVLKLAKEEKMTIFFTTHYLEEAERFADKITIIDHGKIAKVGSSEELKKMTKSKSLEEAFLKITGHEIREEKASPNDNLRRRFGGGRR